MKSRFDFNSVSELTGVFVLLAALTVAVLLTMTARVQRWFEPVFELTIQLPPEDELPTGAEVLQGAAVLIDATVVGKVQEVQIGEDTGIVTAVLAIQGDLVSKLHVDATARVSLPFLAFLGESSIKIAKGNKGEPFLFPKGVREASLKAPASSETDLQEQLREWDRIARDWNEKAVKWEGYFEVWNEKAHKWENYMEQWNETAQQWEARFSVTYAAIDKEIVEPDGKIQVFMDNLNLLLDHLANEGLLEWATRDPKWNRKTLELMDSVQRGTDGTVEVVELFSALLSGGRPLPPPFDETFARLPETMERVNELLLRLEGVVAQVELASQSLPAMAGSLEEDMRVIPGFLIESQETLRQVEIMVRALQRHWLIRSYVDPRPDKGRIPVDEIVGPQGGPR